MKTQLALLFAAVLLSPFAPAQSRPKAHKPAVEMKHAANLFLKSLDAEQTKKATFDFKSEERENWHFVPLDREGIKLSELSPVQDHFANALLATGLSQKGFLTANTIMSLEAILAQRENNPTMRDPRKYYLAIFGNPNAKQGVWGWRFEGHHISLNFTVVDGTVVTTPAFFGANPAHVKQGQFKGTRPLGRLEDLARQLAVSLKDAGKPVVFSDMAPRDILTSQDRTATMPESQGVKGAEMTDEQKKKLMAVVREFASNGRSEISGPALKMISEAVDSLQFAWAGGLKKGEAHYFRVLGADVFLIEYANTQNDANHAHAVWRLFDGDFGRDILKEHYANEH